MTYRYISIEGNIGAGKTSLATRMSEELNARLLLEEFADNPFLGKFYENRERYAFPLELSFLAERYSQLKDVLNTMDLFGNMIISDYFINKCLIFSRANLEGAEYDLFSRMYQIIESNLSQPDLLVYLYLPIEKLIENIKKRGREYEQKIESSYLEEVQESYLEFIRQHPEKRILVLDTEEIDFVNSEEDYQKIRDVILEPREKGIHRVKL